MAQSSGGRQTNGIKSLLSIITSAAAAGTIVALVLAGGIWVGKIDAREYQHAQQPWHEGARERMAEIEGNFAEGRVVQANVLTRLKALEEQTRVNGQKLDRILEEQRAR